MKDNSKAGVLKLNKTGFKCGDSWFLYFEEGVYLNQIGLADIFVGKKEIDFEFW